MDIRFSVRGQSLTSFASELVSDTVGYLCAAFTFSPDWNGLDKWAHLSDEDDRVYDAEIIDGRTQPLNLSAGRWRLWVHGHEITDGQPQVRITTGTVTFRVSQSGALEGEVLPVIETSVSEQVAANAAYAKEVAERILQDAEELLAAAADAKSSADAAADSAKEAEESVKKIGDAVSDAEGFADVAKGYAIGRSRRWVDEQGRTHIEVVKGAKQFADDAEQYAANSRAARNEAYTFKMDAQEFADDARESSRAAESARAAAGNSELAAKSAASAAESSAGVAQTAQVKAETAKSAAETAKSDAETAKSKAETAQSEAAGFATDAKDAADGASISAEKAVGAANDAGGAAEEALDYARRAAESAKQAADAVANAGGSADAVKYTEQELTDEQKAQARKNVGASEYIPLDVTEADTWTTKGEEAAIIVPMYDGGTVSLYKMPSAVGTVLPQEIEVTTKEVYDDGYVNEDVYLTEAHEAFRGEGVTLFDLQPVGIIAVVTKAGTVDFTDAQVEIPEPGVYFYDKRSWENPIEGVQYATMKFTTPYSEVRLKESILPDTAATKQYVDEAVANAGGASSWNDLTGKPTIFEGGDTLTWDGDTTGRTVVDPLGDGSMLVIKVSGVVPAKTDFANGFEYKTFGGENGSASDETTINAFLDLFKADGFLAFEKFFIVPQDSYTFGDWGIDVTFPEKGLYLMGEDYIKSITIPGYTGFGKEVIDPDVLPESVKDTGVEWVKFTTGEELGNGMFSATADKTMDEIISLVEAGKVVTAEIVDPGMITRVPLALCGGDLISFSTVFYAGAAMMMVLTMTKDITYSQTIPIATATS